MNGRIIIQETGNVCVGNIYYENFQASFNEEGRKKDQKEG